MEYELSSPNVLYVTTYSRIRDQIRQDILNSVFKPGVRLRISELTNRYGVSQMPIREALQQLQGEGLVTLLPQKGASVRKIDENFLSNMYDIRYAIETMLVRTGVEHMTDRDLKEIDLLQEEYEAYVSNRNREAALLVNEAFHRKINGLANNYEAIEIIDRHWGLIDVLRRQFGFSEGRIHSIIDDHRKIVNALKRRDRDLSVRLTGEHVMKAKIDLIERFKQSQR
ncbi:GntR family transcriptional regulator [Paenibacillus roseipurpureus]|uniref:GntR family transcriptional regulator n=1 Tax=Paenibacillus roseopurpureus TaxID=2918901 RepID=A0AA96LJN1_9BACL|nr:GntR family transcriptional regulator [Paenibacillus sp. MBLB1832]WNR42975.1 GntR family transcriptional regulator [Paenibacillus sp. MBLB1832]